MTDPIAVAARFLADPSHLEWMRHRPPDQVCEFLEDVESCWRAVVGIARGPAERTYLGPCGAEVSFCSAGAVCQRPNCPACNTGIACDGDMRAYPGATTGRCDRCGATVPVAERREWLDALVGEYNYRAKWLADAFGISVNTIRSWALRGQLAAHGHDEDGHPLYNAAEVRELDRQAKERKAEREARRQRRQEKAA